MGKTALIIFIILATIIFLVFISGLALFMFQYRKRKLMHEREKTIISEAHAKELLTTQLEIQQQTMQHIGREIHDSVGQKLTLAALYTQQLSFKNSYPIIQEQIVSIAGIINESLAELRSLSKNLTNNYILQADIISLIKAECDKVNVTEKCYAVCKHPATKIIVGNTIKTIVLRIVQEFIQNSLKHSGCRCITIDIKNIAVGLCVEAKDDGSGFDAAIPGAHKGIGLDNIRKRAELIGASLSIRSRLEQGTIMRIEVPADKLAI
jgi:signal transduction histidine kinase